MTITLKERALGMLGSGLAVLLLSIAAMAGAQDAPSESEQPPADGPDIGPPPAALAPDEWEDEPEIAGGYVEKDDGIYPDVFGAWGWQNDAYLVGVGLINLYFHDEDETFGAHVRMLSLGGLSYVQAEVAADGASSDERKYAFAFGLVESSVRLHFVDSVFMAYALGIGALSYDYVVPTLDFSVGLGVEAGGWGIEAGIRTIRLPRKTAKVDGDELAQIVYYPMLYAALELDIGY